MPLYFETNSRSSGTAFKSETSPSKCKGGLETEPGFEDRNTINEIAILAEEVTLNNT